MHISGADPGFQVRGADLKKLRRAEGGAKICGVFRVKNHDFTPKNHIFSNWIRPCILNYDALSSKYINTIKQHQTNTRMYFLIPQYTHHFKHTNASSVVDGGFEP
jgi:hypothetical protein